jgi:dipeptidyl aminopeptidase/acylaminoacyl peptidase
MKNKRWYLLPLLSLSLAALACNAQSPDATPTFDPGAEATPITAETDTPVPDVTEAAPTETAAAAASETPAALATETPTADQAFIAYVLDGQLLVTDISGGVVGGTTQYTQPGVDDGVTDFVWSPSGEYIAYTGLVADAQHVFVVYAEGAGTPVDLGQGAIPAWSPDSTQVAYQNQGQLWLTPIEAPAPRQLTTQDNWAWGRPAWRPDGLGLVVAGQSFDNMGASGNTTYWLYSLPLDGSGTLTPLPGMTAEAEGRLPYDLQFSPDGTKLAYSTSIHLSACASLGNYYVANNDGSGQQAVVSPALDALSNDAEEDNFSAFGYAWRPDSAALLISGLVRDCTDFAGTVVASQLSVVTLAGEEILIAPGTYGPVSVNNAGTLIGTTRLDDPARPGQVQVYDMSGNLVVEVGEGDLARVQP